MKKSKKSGFKADEDKAKDKKGAKVFKPGKFKPSTKMKKIY